MKLQYQALLAALRCAVSDAVWMPEEHTDWLPLLRAAEYHHVTPLLQSALQGAKSVPPEISEALARARQKAAFNEVQQSYVAQQVGKTLKEEKIHHIFLRGTVLKADYPSPELRTMSDVDILVHQEDFSRVRQAIERICGTLIHSDGGHRTYSFAPNVTVEFHPNLIYAASPVGTGINPGWQYAKSGDGGGMTLTEEGFYLNLICHMAYHFASGGTGIRSVLDLWVYRHRHGAQPDGELIRSELERVGLWAFAQQIEALAEHWFGDGAGARELDELGEYIVAGGTYGTARQRALNDTCFAGGKARAAWGRIFYPLDEMKCRFPWLTRAPALLPLAWCLRAAKAVTAHRMDLKNWTHSTMKINQEEIQKHQEWLQRVVHFPS